MRALVIDDSKPIRSILGRMLSELGFEVRCACNGQEALDQLDAEALPDVVTVNWNMPVMDGVGFIRAVRQDPRLCGLRVIMISGEADPDKIESARQLGADDYLVKPLEAEALRSSLQTLGVRSPGEESKVESDVSPRRIGPTTVRKILVVDDSVVIRRTLSQVLDDDPDLEVVATAADGRIALDRLTQAAPDVVLLDVEMPNMNGLEALKQLRKTHPKLPVIMFSSLTDRGATATLEALMLGADDYVPKPAGVNSFNVAKQCICEEIIPRIKQLTLSRAPGGASTLRAPERAHRKRQRRPVDVVVIGISTGGPKALAELLPEFVTDCPVPVVIVQHMPPVFTRHLADKLSQAAAYGVVEGESGQLLRKGEVVIAPGGSHITLERRGRELLVALNQDPPEHSCRPAADVLFRSAAAVCGAGTLAVVMTGMGKDGLSGCRAVIDAGGQVLAQDEASSVVWGMPGHVAQAGLADAIVPLNQLGTAIRQRLSGKVG